MGKKSEFPKGKILVTTRDRGKSFVANGYRHACGLGIYRTDYGKWSVTHLASGYGLHWFGKMYQAREYVRRVSTLCDWTQSAPEVLRCLHQDDNALKAERAAHVEALNI